MVMCNYVGLQFICYATLEQGSTICCGVKGTISEAQKIDDARRRGGGGWLRSANVNKVYILCKILAQNSGWSK